MTLYKQDMGVIVATRGGGKTWKVNSENVWAYIYLGTDWKRLDERQKENVHNLPKIRLCSAQIGGFKL